MPPFAIPPLIAAATLGAVIAGRWVRSEYRRVNAELDALRGAREPIDRSRLPKLRRDPVSGEYRPW